jgi:hypothetical protein
VEEGDKIDFINVKRIMRKIGKGYYISIPKIAVEKYGWFDAWLDVTITNDRITIVKVPGQKVVRIGKKFIAGLKINEGISDKSGENSDKG